MKCKLEFVYFKTREQSEYINSHKHECYELVYYIKGTGISRIGEVNVTYAPYTYALISPDCAHDERHFEATNVLFIGFSCKGMEASIKNGIYFDDYHHTILSYLMGIKKELSEQRKYYEIKVDLLLKQLLIEFERSLDATYVKSVDFSYIKQFIKENYNQSIDLRVLAELSGYSYHHFRHLFKNRTGFSPVNYIICEKVNNAKKLLLETNLTISEISNECGFSNESQFSSIFKRLVEQTPSSFRKSSQD